jgi:hypothetical protein
MNTFETDMTALGAYQRSAAKSSKNPKTSAQREAERRMRQIEEEELQEQLALRERRKALEKEAYARGVSIEEMAAIDANRRKEAYARQQVWGPRIAGWTNSFSTPSFPS